MNKEESRGLQRDALRYRWLCSHKIIPSPSLWDAGVGFTAPIKASRSGAIEKPELDAAIDAAMSAAPAMGAPEEGEPQP